MKQTLYAHDMKDMDRVPVISMENTTGWLSDLSVTEALELQWTAATLRMLRQLIDMAKKTPDKFCGSSGIFQGDVVGDSIQAA